MITSPVQSFTRHDPYRDLDSDEASATGVQPETDAVSNGTTSDAFVHNPYRKASSNVMSNTQSDSTLTDATFPSRHTSVQRVTCAVPHRTMSIDVPRVRQRTSQQTELESSSSGSSPSNMRVSQSGSGIFSAGSLSATASFARHDPYRQKDFIPTVVAARTPSPAAVPQQYVSPPLVSEQPPPAAATYMANPAAPMPVPQVSIVPAAVQLAAVQQAAAQQAAMQAAAQHAAAQHAAAQQASVQQTAVQHSNAQQAAQPMCVVSHPHLLRVQIPPSLQAGQSSPQTHSGRTSIGVSSVGPHSLPSTQQSSPANSVRAQALQTVPQQGYVFPVSASPSPSPVHAQQGMPQQPVVVQTAVVAAAPQTVSAVPAPAEPGKEKVDVVISRSPGVALGVVWSRRGLRLNHVMSNTPAEVCGLGKCTGLALIAVNDVPVTKVKDFLTLSEGQTQFKLTFEPSQSLRALKAPRLPITDLPPQYIDASKMPTVVEVVFKYGRVGEVATTLPVENMLACRGHAWLVEAAKGIDLCVIRTARPNNNPSTAPQFRMCRPASAEEVQRSSHDFVEKEAEALRFVLEKAKRLRAKVNIHACEFQIDGMKLTIHYSSNEAKPDFRQLVYEAFKEYRVRIWMNNCKPTVGQPGDYLDPTLLPARPHGRLPTRKVLPA